MTATTVDEAARILADPIGYTDEARMHAHTLKHLPIRYAIK